MASGHPQPGHRRGALHHRRHREAARHARLRQAGRGQPHPGRGAGARARAARLSQRYRHAQVGCRRASSARAASRARLVLRQSSGVASPSPMSTRMQSRAAGGRSTSAGTASAERCRGRGVEAAGLRPPRHVVRGDEPLRVEHGQAEQGEHPGGHHRPGEPARAQPQHGDQRQQEARAEPELAGQHQQPQHGEPVGLLVEPHPVDRRRDDDEGEQRQRGEQAPLGDPLGRRAGGRPPGAEGEHPQRERRHREQLPEPAAGVLGVGEAGGAQHVVVRAEQHDELHADEQREHGDQHARWAAPSPAGAAGWGAGRAVRLSAGARPAGSRRPPRPPRRTRTGRPAHDGVDGDRRA